MWYYSVVKYCLKPLVLNTLSFIPRRDTLKVSGKQNSLFPLGPVIKCLLWSQQRTLIHMNMKKSNIGIDLLLSILKGLQWLNKGLLLSV